MEILKQQQIITELVTLDCSIDLENGTFVYSADRYNLEMVLSAIDVLDIKLYETDYDHKTDSKIYTYKIKYIK